MKKITIPLIDDGGVSEQVGYESECAGLGVFKDREVGDWRLTHIPSGLVVGIFRTRQVALRAAELHNEIDFDFTRSADDLREDPESEEVMWASIAACSIAMIEDQLGGKMYDA